MRKIRTAVEGERFIHKELWRVVDRQLEHAERNRTGAFYDELVAMVFAFHAFEAYLNYVGEHLAPDIWKDERNFFRKEPYRGFDGKIRKLLELVGMPEPDRAVRPYSSVWMLKDLRDLMAHGKVERYSHVVEHSDDSELLRMSTRLDSMVTAQHARDARDDIYEFSQQLHSRAQAKIKDVWFGSRAYEGAIQHGEGSSQLAS